MNAAREASADPAPAVPVPGPAPEVLPGDALAKQFVKDASGAVVAHPVAGIVTLILFMDLTGARASLIWYGVLLVGTAIRFVLGREALKALDRPMEARRWAFWGAMVVGAAWGAGGVLFGLTLPGDQVGILFVIMAGLVAAATATLVADGPSFYGFSTVLLGSVFVSVGLRGFGLVNSLDPNLSFGLSALILTFWVVMSVLHRGARLQLAESLKTRRELRDAQEQYQSLIESAQDLVWQIDEEGNWTFLNAAAQDIYGALPEELLGTSALDRAEKEFLEKDIAAFGKLLEGSEMVDHETVHQRVDGDQRHLSFSARPLRAASGEITGAQGTARDVTDRAKAREALQEVAKKNSLVRSLINGTEDMIFYKDGEGVYQGCNHMFADFIGLPEDEIVGRTDEELVGPERAAAYRKSDYEALTAWDPVRYEEWVVDHEGNRRLFETVKTVFRHAEGNTLGLLGVVRDSTERKEAEERMRELAENAERATRMKSAFLANMSHEIRTPLNGVLGMTEILLESELTPEQRQHLQIIRSSGESLLGVLNDVLDISKIEAGHLDLEQVSFDLHEEMQDSVALFSHPAVERGNEIMVDIRPEVPRGVLGDSTRLRQVLSNLVGNAVKFTERGEILVSASAVGGEEGEARIRFSVKDNGVGIPEEKQQAIFEEFTQADSSTTREYGGTGLGLTISRHLVSIMGGRLRLESTEGEGSEFFFTLNLPADPDFVPRTVPEEGLDLKGIKALIVDDVETNRRIFKDFLETAGAEVQVTERAVEALNLLRTVQTQAPFDFAVLDLLMPGRDGFQLAEDIRLDPDLRDLPILILTSSNRPGDRKIAARLRVNGFLQKPVSRVDLLRGVSAILERRVREGEAVPGEPSETGRVADDSPSSDLPRGLKVLVAEDNLVNQQVALGLLKRWGCQVTLAVNGLEALESLEAGLPDLILMDVRMPEMDGLEATRMIRTDARFSGLPIIALTAHVLPAERQECKEAGMDDYLPKPFKPGDLREKVEFWAKRALGSEEVESGGRDPVGPGEPENASLVSPPTGGEGGKPPVYLDEFRAGMKEAGIEHVVDAAVEAYIGETPGRMAALEAAVDAGDMRAVEIEAHGVKSGSRSIRADHFGRLLEEVEAAGREEREEDVRTLFPEAKAAFEEVMEYLESQVPSDG